MTKMRYLINYPFGGHLPVQILPRKVPKSSIRDYLYYMRDSIEPASAAQLKAMLADDPDATVGYINPADPDSGVTVITEDGRRIPGHIYFADQELAGD